MAVLTSIPKTSILIAQRKERKDMKYQVYLNKETSILINDLAERNNLKPNTFIKTFMEKFMKIYSATNDQLERELSNGTRKQ